MYFSCRFEQEILTPHSASDLPRVIIGSSTYNQVSAQLKKLREATGSSFGSIEERERKALEVSAQLKLLRAQTELVAETELSDTEGQGSIFYVLHSTSLFILLTLFILSDGFSHTLLIQEGLICPFCILRGHSLEFLNFDIFLSLKIVFCRLYKVQKS